MARGQYVDPAQRITVAEYAAAGPAPDRIAHHRPPHDRAHRQPHRRHSAWEPTVGRGEAERGPGLGRRSRETARAGDDPQPGRSPAFHLRSGGARPAGAVLAGRADRASPDRASPGRATPGRPADGGRRSPRSRMRCRTATGPRSSPKPPWDCASANCWGSAWRTSTSCGGPCASSGSSPAAARRAGSRRLPGLADDPGPASSPRRGSRAPGHLPGRRGRSGLHHGRGDAARPRLLRAQPLPEGDGVGWSPRRNDQHDLRHRFASPLLAAGESVVAVAERLGYDDASLVLSTYGHLMPDSEDRTRRAVDAAWGAVGAACAPDVPQGVRSLR
jgi:hypothetical protein